MFVIPISIELPIVMLTHAPHAGFWVGVGLGAGTAAAMVLFDSPSAHIERWRIGADGEKATSRQLRPLLKRGWTLFNDIATGQGNVDHVLVGPAGVFVLESKRLAGRVRVDAGTLFVRWHEEPEDGYENDTIAGRARGTAFELHSRLNSSGMDSWVQAVVVLWSDFAQRSIECDKVAWIRGDMLTAVLAARPVKYSGDALDVLTSATRLAVRGLREEPLSPSKRL